MHQTPTELDFEKLPGIPAAWLDFLHSRLPLLPASQHADLLPVFAKGLKWPETRREGLCGFLEKTGNLSPGRAPEVLRKLRQPESVVVVAGLYPALFGGPAFQLMKCLTAVKICERLDRQEIPAVPVCWIHEPAQGVFPAGSVQLLDPESEIHCLSLQSSGTGDFAAGESLPGGQISALLAQADSIGRGAYDPEILGMLGNSFSAGTTLAQASAALIAGLMEEWGMVVLNAACPGFQSDLHSFLPSRARGRLPVYAVQSLMLPAVACVVDPRETDAYLGAQPAFDAIGATRPPAWPRSSATILDARSRKFIERYHLDPYQLYSGKDAIVGKFADSMPRDASEKLLALKQNLEECVEQLGALYAAGSENGKTAVTIREKIAFQLNRLRNNFDAACQNRQETISRHVRRVCNSLAPNGRLQEMELAGIQFPLRYSRAVLRSLYEKLDIMRPEHQLIFMD